MAKRNPRITPSAIALPGNSAIYAKINYQRARIALLSIVGNAFTSQSTICAPPELMRSGKHNKKRLRRKKVKCETHLGHLLSRMPVDRPEIGDIMVCRYRKYGRVCEDFESITDRC